MGPSWPVLGSPFRPETVMRQHSRNPRATAGNPRRFVNLGSGPLISSGPRTEAQGKAKGTEDTPTPCLEARWRIQGFNHVNVFD